MLMPIGDVLIDMPMGGSSDDGESSSGGDGSGCGCLAIVLGIPVLVCVVLAVVLIVMTFRIMLTSHDTRRSVPSRWLRERDQTEQHSHTNPFIP